MDDSDLRLVVDCASLAPSVHNTQPWRFHLDGDRIEVWADRERALAYLDPTGRQLHVSCGAAIEFARLAVRDLGQHCDVSVLPDAGDSELLAVLTVGDAQPPSDTERALEHAPAAGPAPFEAAERQSVYEEAAAGAAASS